MKKLLLAAGLAATTLFTSAPAHAAAYFIAGQWYYFSLNFESLIAKVTGKDIKLGTFVAAEVKILAADAECSNPQLKVIAGTGPEGMVSGVSRDVTDSDLVKSDRKQGNIYSSTTTLADLVPEDQRLDPPPGLCKNAPGASQWFPLFWQDRDCDKAKAADELVAPICYRERAAFVNGVLTYVTGPNAGQWVGVNSAASAWTYVYLPTSFKYKATLNNDQTQEYSYVYGQCQFPPNDDAGAVQPGAPYSITNPPVNGWAALPPVYYQCVTITANQYAAP